MKRGGRLNPMSAKRRAAIAERRCMDCQAPLAPTSGPGAPVRRCEPCRAARAAKVSPTLRSCAACEAPFESARGRKVYCSPNCAADARRQSIRRFSTFKCEVCEASFQRRSDQPSKAADKIVRCSACSRSARSTGRQYPARKTGETVACEQCGADVYRQRYSRRRFCGRGCFNAWQRLHPREWVGQVDNAGPKNGRYVHGKRTGINTSARKIVRQEVAQRDGDWCLLCGLPPKGLHLHRVHYGSEGGKYETSNCVQLCGSHHSVVHSSKRTWKPLLLAYLDGQPDVLLELQGLVARRSA